MSRYGVPRRSVLAPSGWRTGSSVSGRDPQQRPPSGVAHTAWQTLTDAVEAIPDGSWTSYGELARLIGSHPVPVGTYRRTDGVPHALVCSRRVAPSLRPSRRSPLSRYGVPRRSVLAPSGWRTGSSVSGRDP
ncbi:hypothetical protein D9C01_12685, partial [Corynebacterium diphtheriae]